MENIWEEMQQRYAKQQEEGTVQKSNAKPQMRTIISRDRMQAFFSLEFPMGYDESEFEKFTLTDREVLAYLKKQRIEYGIMHDKIQGYCQNRLFRQEIQVAEGTAPIPGEDGTYTFHVETETNGKPKMLDDGRVDYHQLDLIRNVMAGDVLCTVIQPKLGEAGRDVFGKIVPPRVGIPAPIRAGKNVVMVPGQEEGVILLAAETDGRVELKMGCIAVDPIYLVIGDVGPKTGHIDFKGSVKVMGNVLEGFNVSAGKDVHISGRVEGSLINAGGDVVIEDGVAGMDKAIICVKGNFTSRFLENATVICGGDVCCDIALRSFIKAKGAILMDGQRGALVGGECLSGVEITVRTLGSQRNLAQNVSVLPGWFNIPDFQEEFLEDQQPVDTEESMQILTTLKERLNECKINLDDTKAMVLDGDFESISRMKKLMDLRVQLEGQINEVRHQIRHGAASVEAAKKAQNSKIEKRQAKVTCRGTVYPGVRIFIEHEALTIMDEIKYCFFIKDQDEVYVGRL